MKRTGSKNSTRGPIKTHPTSGFVYLDGTQPTTETTQDSQRHWESHHCPSGQNESLQRVEIGDDMLERQRLLLGLFRDPIDLLEGGNPANDLEHAIGVKR